jgi:hypothetical protein
MKEYYVYAILDPNILTNIKYNELVFTNQPFYIGYGKNNRMDNHLHKKEMDRKCHKSSKIISILNSGNNPIFIKIKENLSFEEANELEIFLIKLMGRSDNNTGILTNHTDGGSGTKNKVTSEETKKKISDSKMGILHTEESKLKMRLKRLGSKMSNKTKDKLSISKSGKGNAFYGKHHNLDTLSTCKKVYQLDRITGEIIKQYPSVMEAERVNNFKHIHDVCNGKRKSAGGFNWRYV